MGLHLLLYLLSHVNQPTNPNTTIRGLHLLLYLLSHVNQPTNPNTIRGYTYTYFSISSPMLTSQLTPTPPSGGSTYCAIASPMLTSQLTPTPPSGGSTYCAIASLVLSDTLDSAMSYQQIDALRRWCVNRQLSGFQGRPNKDADTCYSFWIGATLKVISAFPLVWSSPPLPLLARLPPLQWHRSYNISCWFTSFFVEIFIPYKFIAILYIMEVSNLLFKFSSGSWYQTFNHLINQFEIDCSLKTLMKSLIRILFLKYLYLLFSIFTNTWFSISYL